MYKMIRKLFFLWLMSEASLHSYCCNHDAQRAAWGGNGGNWGNPHSMYRDGWGWPDRSPSICGSYYSQYLYYRNPSYPYAEQCHSQSVDGAALYLRMR